MSIFISITLGQERNLKKNIAAFISKNLYVFGLPRCLSGKETPCQCRRCRRCGFDPWVGEIPWVGSGNPLQYSSMENSMDRGAWWATKSWTWHTTHTHTHTHTHVCMHKHLFYSRNSKPPILHLGFSSILSLFFNIVLEHILILFFSMKLSSFLSTAYWRDCLSLLHVRASFVID